MVNLLAVLCISISLLITAFPATTVSSSSHLLNLRAALKSAIHRTDAALSNLTTDSSCRYLLDLTLSDLRWCLAALQDLASGGSSDEGHASDLRTRLSAALTHQNICQEELPAGPYANGTEELVAARRYLGGAELLTHGLVSMASRLQHNFPPKLAKLAAGGNPFAACNVTVAQDGSGDFRSIADALSSAPDGNTALHYVIHVKQGTYHEYLKVDYRKHNVVLVGEGIGRTIITGDRSNYSGYSTFNSATLAVDGPGFIAIGLTIENTAGASAGQAVAVRAGSDFSAFYRCEIKGNQDTLFAISKRQFYRECRISGTVDFIFGNAAAVFQRCDIVSRRRAVGNVIAASSRMNRDEPTGFSFHRCSVWGEPGAPVTYLGRPWKQYARTVFVETRLGHVVAAEGWSGWNNRYLDTVYYAEYRDRGPGAQPWKRVKWGGVHALTDPNEAARFLPTKFIQGDRWIPATGIPYDDRL
ncbi:unnamed protein product [Linum trigynum]|uniref:Pectinesterase n=1 Tax=Linum trigynum TaxID=586398 RepID=A0AAV2D9H6_9ROSI